MKLKKYSVREVDLILFDVESQINSSLWAWAVILRIAIFIPIKLFEVVTKHVLNQMLNQIEIYRSLCRHICRTGVSSDRCNNSTNHRVSLWKRINAERTNQGHSFLHSLMSLDSIVGGRGRIWGTQRSVKTAGVYSLSCWQLKCVGTLMHGSYYDVLPL